jgi:Dolichyl-phosphate-mannose-protein mannosyltransferase
MKRAVLEPFRRLHRVTLALPERAIPRVSMDFRSAASSALRWAKSIATAVSQKRAYWVDAVGILLALVYAWPTTAYRFGRDQALFFYIGREWLNGSVPYKDTFDLKPPAIYLLHAISITILGPHQWSIRVFEVFGVVVLAIVAALAVRRVGPRVPGELGVAAILASGWYFTVFDYWDTGQVELWESLCLVGAYAVLMRAAPGSIWRRCLTAGCLTGLAGLFKFTAAVPALGLGALTAGYGFWASAPPFRNRAVGTLIAVASFGLGVGVVWGVTALYFIGSGATAAVGEFFEYVAAYSKSDFLTGSGSSLIELFWTAQSSWWAALFAAAWVVATGSALRRREWSVIFGALSAAVLLGACILSVSAQRKYFLYHWGVIAGFFLILPLYAARCVGSWPAAVRLVPAVGMMVGAWFAAPAWHSNTAMTYRKFMTEIWWPPPPVDDENLNRVFRGISAYNYSAQRAIARAILPVARDGDLLHVRGFELAMYAITGMRTPARFVSELPVEDRRLSTHPQRWAKEHEHAIWSARPRFVVTFNDRPRDLEAIAARGYRELKRAGMFVAFERND